MPDLASPFVWLDGGLRLGFNLPDELRLGGSSSPAVSQMNRNLRVNF
jgi:hypothetical protein